MEYGRFGQTQTLREQGWTTDEDCQRLQMADDRMGGPTFMKDTQGRIHEVSLGETVLLSGSRKRASGPYGTLVGIGEKSTMPSLCCRTGSA